MNEKVLIAFVISHLKKAIYELECTNKLKPNTINADLISELKTQIILIKNECETLS